MTRKNKAKDSGALIAAMSARFPAHPTCEVSMLISRPLCSVHDELKFGPLLIFGEQIAFHCGGKSALRADRQLIERNKPCRFVDAADEVFLALDLGAL